jgi:hypothetical protein
MAMFKANIITGIEQGSNKPIQVKSDFKYVENFIVLKSTSRSDKLTRIAAMQWLSSIFLKCFIVLRFCPVTHRFLEYSKINVTITK